MKFLAPTGTLTAGPALSYPKNASGPCGSPWYTQSSCGVSGAPDACATGAAAVAQNAAAVSAVTSTDPIHFVRRVMPTSAVGRRIRVDGAYDECLADARSVGLSRFL